MVYGVVDMKIKINVYDLETKAIEIDRYGKLRITDPVQFFIDWIDAWDAGVGELLGATENKAELYEDDEQ